MRRAIGFVGLMLAVLILPGEEVWVVGEHRSTGERKYCLSNLPAVRQAILHARAQPPPTPCPHRQRSISFKKVPK